MRSKNTRPELELRRALRALGLRYRIHRRDLPGTPDIAFIGARLAVFVHGCFWHRHSVCVGTRFSANVTPEWARRFNAAVAKDSMVEARLRALGWQSMVAWECRIEKNPLAEATRIEARLAKLKGDKGPTKR